MILYSAIDSKYKTKRKIEIFDFIKIWNFCALKDIINQVKRQLAVWEVIVANHTSEKSLVSRVYKELLKFNNKKKT